MKTTIITLLVLLLFPLSFVFAGGDTSLEGRKSYLIEHSQKGERYVQAIDKLIEKYKDREKILEKLQTRIKKLKQKKPINLDNKRSVEIYAILNYIEERIKLVQTKVETGDYISVHYTGKLKDGTQFDSSYERGVPLNFTVGNGQMISGFDSGVLTMRVGEKKILTLTPIEAYGEYDDENVKIVSKSELEVFETQGYDVDTGNYIPTQFGDILIVETTNTTVTLDLNHSLAGKTLIFEVELISIQR